MKLKKISVLLIDGDYLIHQSMSSIFQNLGCNVDIAEYGKDAIKMFAKNKYHIVFMEIAILDIDGFTIAENFREIEKQKKQKPRIPILAITAFDEKSFKRRARSVGINDYLLKPITIEGYKNILKKFFPKNDWEQEI